MDSHPESAESSMPVAGAGGGEVSLVATDGKGSQATFDLVPGRRYSVGRHRGNDIVLVDPSLSRRHAEIWFEDGGWRIADLGSSNGTFLDGKPLAQPAVLGPGVWVTVGPYTLSLGVPRPRRRVTFTDIPIASSGTLVLSSDDAAVKALRSSGGELSEEIQPELEAMRLRLGLLERANLELLAHQPVELLLPKILELVLEAIQVDRAAILRREKGGELLLAAVKGDEPGEFTLSRSVASRVLEEKISILTSDAQEDERFAGQHSIMGQGIRAIMAVPLASGEDDDVTGLLYADSRLGKKLFDGSDLRLLTMLGNIAAIQIRNSLLFEAQVEKRRLEKEADAAAAIQRRLLPREHPVIPRYSFAASSSPCTEVGGDYFDCLPMDGGRFGICLGDVAGKGMGAALLMAALHATLQARMEQGPAPDALVAHLGRAVERDAPSNRFVTLFLAELHPEENMAKCINAGHAPAPLRVRRTGQLERIESSGPPLGIRPDFTYAVTEIRLEPGDLLVACTDGVTELENSRGEMFGQERLESFLVEAAGREPGALRRDLLHRLEEFAAGMERLDDLTLVVLRRDS